MASSYISVSLPPELATRIKKVACTEGKSLSQFFREAAGIYLSQLAMGEDEERIDPATVYKAYRQMRVIVKDATKVQVAMEDVKKMMLEI